MKDNSKFSSFGVIVAMAGSAVGLGNIWRFPYLVGENGGAAFILIYLAIVLLISLPIFLSEFVIGKRSQSNPVGAYRKLAPGSKWHWVGILGVAAAFVLMSFYCVVGGWSTNYLVRSLGFQFSSANSPDFAGIFSNCVETAWPPIIYMIVFMIMTAIILLGGVKSGIEKFCKVMMPTLFFLVLFIAIYAMCLPGAGEGIRYLFRPDFSKVTGNTLIAALGQAFFSLSLGMGCMVTYASYASPDENATRCSVITAISDTAFAIIAGCAVMPAVFAFGGNPESGPGLVFLTLPQIFEKMPLGSIVAILFFLALLLAALTSAISLVEVMLAYLIQEFKMRRGVALALVFTLICAVGSLCSLSQGAVPGLKLFGMDFLSFMDYTSANIMMTIGALLTVLFIGWKLGKGIFREELTNHGSLNMPEWFVNMEFFIIKYVVPLVIILIMIASL